MTLFSATYHRILITLMIAFIPFMGDAQCPRVYNYNGNPSSAPYWYSCTGDDFSFNLQSPNNWQGVTINWGDGSPDYSAANWNTPQSLQHLYTATVDTFVVTIKETATGCTIKGVVVMEEPTSASIQIPVGGLTQACAPQTMEFINSSTNVSETTVFTWDFGDGSAPLTFDHTNWHQTVSHLYNKGTVNCETKVSLTAKNYCNTIQGGQSKATFNPIRIWDLDEAAISASATLLCYPDTTVTFTNSTKRNCYLQGNIYQRYEYWNFGDHWGLGHDSIIDWTPWPPTFPKTIHFPGIGEYTIQMLDSNFCGIDPASITIRIVPPPNAAIAASKDTVCVGESITFYQQATGNPNSFSWNFGTGAGWVNTGSGNINYTFNQPGTFTVQSRVSITGSSSACNDIASVQVVVLPPPVVDLTANPPNACDSAVVQFSAVSPGSSNWQWSFGGGQGTYSGQNPPLVTYSAPGIYTASLTVSSGNGCSATDQVQVNVHRTPEAAFNVMSLCEGDTAEFWDNSFSLPAEPIVSWAWDFGDGGVSAEENPSYLYTDTGEFNVKLIVSTGFCQDTVTSVLEVGQVAQADASVDFTSGCSPLQVHFTNGSTGAVSYLWRFGDGAISSDAEPGHTYVNSLGQDTIYTVILEAFNAFGCADSDTLYVEILSGALASFTDNNPSPSCTPYNATFSNFSQNAVSYKWDFGDGGTSLAENPSHTYVNNTGFVQTVTVSLIAYSANGCHDTISDPMILFPVADFSFDLSPDSGCAPLNVQMPFLSGIQNYYWTFGDGQTSTLPAPVHLYQNNGTESLSYEVSLIGKSPFGCIDTAYSSVLVHPSPTAQYVTDFSSGCSPLNVTFTNQSVNGESYQWTYGDGTTSASALENHTHTFTNQSNETREFISTLKVTSSQGCTGTFSVPVNVFPRVRAEFEQPDPACAPAVIEFDNTSVNADYYTWDFGNGLTSTLQNPEITFINTSQESVSYPVTLNVVSAEGCEDEFSSVVVVNPQPFAHFQMGQSEACAPAPIVLTNQSENAVSYSWNYADGTMSANASPEHTHIFNTNGQSLIEFNVVLTAIGAGGCTDTAQASFTLFPQVVAAFTGTTQGCSPLSGSFVNQSFGASDYEWSFGDGGSSSVTSPTHVFTTNNISDAVYNTSLVARSAFGCVDTMVLPVNVFHRPVAAALIDSLFGCYPQMVTFQNASVGADSYQWVYGNGQVSDTLAEFHTTAFYNYTESVVTYDVTLFAYTDNGCQSSDDLEVQVTPELTADFNVTAQGCTPLTVQFDNNSDGALSWHWSFGDGDYSDDQEPEHTFFNWGQNDTTYTVNLVISNIYGCTDTAYTYINVYALPVAGFNADPMVQTWPNATVNFTNTTIGGTLSYHWSFGDVSESGNENPGSHTYSTWGNYLVKLVVDNGSCSDTASRTVKILPPVPVAEFTGPAEGCVPLTVQFTNLSEYASGYTWLFGDGGQANAANPVYTYYQPGVYSVTLQALGFDGSTDILAQEMIIHVYPRAIASFMVTPNEVTVPSQPVYCINLSDNADRYEWSFGDGSVSNETNPVYQYLDEGVFTVMLVANNENNCPDTMIVVDAVYTNKLGNIDFPNAFTPKTGGGEGGTYNSNGFDNDVFFPLHKGVDEYQLQIFNKWGELLFESRDVKRGWDGYYRGELCKQDVYVWKVRARFVDGQSYEGAGDVTLLVR